VWFDEDGPSPDAPTDNYRPAWVSCYQLGCDWGQEVGGWAGVDEAMQAGGRHYQADHPSFTGTPQLHLQLEEI
jgi:hypothetical protein